MEDKFDITVEMDKDATIQILRDVHKRDTVTIKNLKQIIITICICFSAIICFAISWYFWNESQFETVETTEYSEEMSTDGDSAYINNVEGSQYNDNATHTEGTK